MSIPEELTDDQLDELGQVLRALRVHLRRLFDKTEDAAKPVELDQTAFGRVSRIDAIQQQQMTGAGRRRAEMRLQQVERALEAFEDDEYGWCRKCGETIGYGRLKARPETPFCVDCATEMERGRPR